MLPVLFIYPVVRQIMLSANLQIFVRQNVVSFFMNQIRNAISRLNARSCLKLFSCVFGRRESEQRDHRDVYVRVRKGVCHTIS